MLEISMNEIQKVENTEDKEIIERILHIKNYNEIKNSSERSYFNISMYNNPLYLH